MQADFTAEIETGQEVRQNVVVVSGVESDVPGAAGLNDGPDHIQRLISIKWRDLDGNHIFDLHKTPPELKTQNAPAD